MQRGWRRGVPYAVGLAALAGMIAPLALAASHSVTLAPGDSLTVGCQTTLSGTVGARQANLACAALEATNTPTATPTGASASPHPCGTSAAVWHPAVDPTTGCQYGHEHGDAPPAWIAAAGYEVSFNGPFNTSAKEDTVKHTSFKGFATTINQTDLYFVLHFASNAMERSGRYHSYQAWGRDASGNVSHWQGWVNSGDPNTSRVPISRGDPGFRPIVLTVDQASWDNFDSCEQWYSFTSAWSWDLGWNICGSTTIYPGPSENNDPFNQSTWKITGDPGGLRTIDASWYGGPTGASPNRGNPPKDVKFYATQFGQIVSGPNDPVCSGTSLGQDGVTYQNVCLDEFIASTMPTVQFPGNEIQKNYNVTGVHAPN